MYLVDISEACSHADKLALLLAAVLFAGVNIEVFENLCISRRLKHSQLKLVVCLSRFNFASLRRCSADTTMMLQARHLLGVSNDGSCGARNTGNTCPPGKRCSQFGYCGTGAPFCASQPMEFTIPHLHRHQPPQQQPLQQLQHLHLLVLFLTARMAAVVL